MKNPVSLLRKTALLEAVSYLLLVGVAMPLKYIFHMPQAVQAVGMIHGLLFVVLCLSLLQVIFVARWPLLRAAGVFFASMLPFVPFFMDRWMRSHEEAFAEARQEV